MAAELPERTEESVMKFVFGDEVSSAHLQEVMSSNLAQTYNEVVSGTTRRLWGRRVLPLDTIVLMNLAILACLNRPRELYTRCVGLLRGGVSVDEINEVFLHIGFYVGNPAGVEAMAALYEAIEDLDQRGISYREHIDD